MGPAPEFGNRTGPGPAHSLKPTSPLLGLAHPLLSAQPPYLYLGENGGGGEAGATVALSTFGQWQGKGRSGRTCPQQADSGPLCAWSYLHLPQSTFPAPMEKLRSRGAPPTLSPGFWAISFTSNSLLFITKHRKLVGRPDFSSACLREDALCGSGPLPHPGPQTHRLEEHGEEIDHGLHVEPPLGSDADSGEEGQAAEGRQEKFGYERPHGQGRKGGCWPPGSPKREGLLPSVGAPMAAVV